MTDEGVAARIEIVSASAGSGKTYRLAETLRRAVMEEGVRPDAVLATTFTRRAAAELQERARTHLLAAGRLDDAHRLAAARIGTVNAVCGRIVAENAFDLGLSPRLRVLDEAAAGRAVRRALSRVLEDQDTERLAELADRLTGFEWEDHILRTVELARLNDLGPADLAAGGRRSLEEMGELLDPVTSSDLDAELLGAIEAFVEGRDPADATKKTTDLVNLAESTAHDLKRHRAVQWRAWNKLATDTPAKKSEDVYAPVAEAARRHLSHPRLHEDVTEATELVMRLAGDVLEAYRAYKERWGVIDFADQELLCLKLLDRPGVRRRLAEEIDLVLVDEFQDTSPVELAIFLRLAEIAPRSVWVGDQKQAIFSFRGTSPELMEAAVDAIAGAAGPETLSTSYRSRPELVEVTSEVFGAAFAEHGVRPGLVRLSPALSPDEDPPEAGHAFEWWAWSARNQNEDAQALAAAVADLLADATSRVRERGPAPDGAPVRTRPITPGDVAVLCRTHAAAARVAAELENIGLRAVLPRAGLLATPEGQLVLAALRLWVDGRDRLAAAVLGRLTGEPEEPEGWLAAALTGPREPFRGPVPGPEEAAGRPAPPGAPTQLALDLSDRRLAPVDPPGGAPAPTRAGATAAIAPPTGRAPSSEPPAETPATPADALCGLPVARAILAARRISPMAGPVAAFDRLVESTDAWERCLMWGDAARRTANLDALRALVVRYEEEATAEGRAATVAGLVADLLDLAETGEDAQAVIAAEDAVVVTTWHQAKGLEWPVTVLFHLDFVRDEPPLGVSAVSPAGFNLDAPLAGRWLRYWVHPYHPATSTGPFHERMAVHPANVRQQELNRRESLRLLYVGWTRARDRLVLAARTEKRGKPGILDYLGAAEAPLIQPPEALPGLGVGARTTVLHWAGLDVPVGVRESAPSPPTPIAPQPGLGYVTAPTSSAPAARVAASRLTGEGRAGGAIVLGARLDLLRPVPMDRLGEAVHGFLAADLPGLPPEERPLLVSSLLARWDVAGALDPTAVVAAADRLAGWVRASYPGAAWRREVPLAVRLDAEAARTLATADAAGPTLGPGTVLVGTADLVLETTDGLVLIDHKTFPGGVTEAAAKAAGFAGQLAAYSLALRRATGSDLLAAYIHLPVLGLVYPVSPASSASRNDATLSSS